MLESLVNTLRRVFAGKPNKTTINDLRLGDIIELRFRDPRKMGLLDPSGQLTKRYDPDDLQTRMLFGMVTNTFVMHGMRFFELTVTKIVNGGPQTRVYTIMEDDVESLRIVKNENDSKK